MANSRGARKTETQRRAVAEKDRRASGLEPDDLVSPHVYVPHYVRQRVRALSAMADVSAEMAYGYLLSLCLKKFTDEQMIQALRAYERGEGNLISNTQEV